MDKWSLTQYTPEMISTKELNLTYYQYEVHKLFFTYGVSVSK